ncbi:MAG: hypothetical protein KDA85_19150 [Planctomycetaceae bacterium]|nr:hypothetical protein [Planctomycetaceae bacterium]
MRLTSADISIKRLLAAVAVTAIAGTVLACQVPVFRYAFERWNPDRYRILILNDGEFNSEHHLLVQAIQKASSQHLQIDVRSVDVAGTRDSHLVDIWKTHREQSAITQPLLVAQYPISSTVPEDGYACQFPLTQDAVDRLTVSPARKEIARRLSEGQSAVWVLLESGDEGKDQAALTTLKKQLGLDAAWLKLPSPEELEVDPDVLSQVKVPLKIEFSVLSVRKDDPQESVLTQSLLNSEADLHEYADEPLAFPIFGRGRVLYALVGKGIAPDTIRAATTFITGPCSCQVKSQNPGFDLLLDHDWNESVGELLISDPLPETPKKPTLIPIPPGKK